jgi:glutamate decarboxylase
MIAHLFNAPIKEDETAIGVGTVGSSEAIMLAGLAFKRKWQNKRKEQGKPCDRPNIVTGANVQVLCVRVQLLVDDQIVTAVCNNVSERRLWWSFLMS